jgi:ferredoxin-NADP reductase
VSNPPPVDVPLVGAWQDATITSARVETPRVKTFSLRLARLTPHLAGQHFVVRLTAPDGYTAQRSYSIASPPGDGWSIDLTVERLPDGEVSTFLHDELQVGDTLEVRGPIGGWFVWNGSTPALLIGGGSGVVPLMAMLRVARQHPQQSLAHLLVSVREPNSLIYADELVGDDVTVLFTRSALPSSIRVPGRISLDDLGPFASADATVFICGSAGFAATASDLAVECGFGTGAIRVERFGPTV